jgi:hypothetical protein
MVKTESIAGILYFETEAEVDELILDFFNLKISNIPDSYAGLINDENFKLIVGLNEVHFIKSNKIVLINNFDYDGSFIEFDPYPNLEKILIISEFYCQALWLIRDNSVQLELAYLVFSDEKSKTVHSNFWNSSYSNSKGDRKHTFFSKEEIIESADILKMVIAIHLDSEKRLKKNIILTNFISRLSRAFVFLKSARTTSDIGTKISIYCSVFESLFSISNTELRHRLSEIVAFFLSNDFDERRSIYKTMQTSYDIRSSVVHGDGIQSRFLKNEAKLLIDTAVETDEILRRCFRKILRSKDLYELFTNKSKEELSEYFQNLIFK